MSGPTSNSPAARKERREAAAAVAGVLVRHGLRQGPRTPAQDDDRRLLGDRLRSAFEELGSSFGCAFPILGAYLSRRPDLLPPADCLALAETLPPTVAATASCLPRAFADLGGAKELFSQVSPRPRRRGPLRLQYQALLNDEHPVLVEIVPDELVLDLEQSLPHLALLQGSWGALPFAASLESVLEDFQPWLESQWDLAPALAQLEAFGQDPEGSRRLSLPRPYAYLCGPRRLVLEDPGGCPLGDGDSPGREALARRITLAWLIQAMVSRTYVAELVEEDLLRLPRHGLALRSGGPLQQMGEEDQGNWWSYLQAAAADDPDASCTWLLRECIATSPQADESELHLRLRQVVPFRDGGWTLGGDTLAEKIFLHWRVARDCGFRLRPQSLAVAQGIFAIAAFGRSLDPHGDPLRNALEDLRWMTGWSQLRQWGNLPHMARLLERNAESLMELPAKIERFLERPAAPPPPAPSRSPSQAPMAAAPVAALVALVAATLLTDHLADAGLFGSYGEPVTVLVFLCIGLSTLRLLWRAP